MPTTETSTPTSHASIPPIALVCLRRAARLAVYDPDRAVSIARGILSAYPDFAPAWNALATFCRQRGDGLGFAVALDRCLQLDPAHAPANLSVAELLLVLGDRAGARRHIDRALERAEDLSPRRRAWAERIRDACSVN